MVPGVCISMKCFSQVEYNKASPTVLVGASMTYNEVYNVLDPIDFPITGGSVWHALCPTLILSLN